MLFGLSWSELYQCVVLLLTGLLHGVMSYNVATSFDTFARNIFSGKAVDDAMRSTLTQYDLLPENALLYSLITLLTIAASTVFTAADRTIVCVILAVKSVYHTVDQGRMLVEKGQPRVKDLMKDEATLRAGVAMNGVNAVLLVTAAMAGLAGLAGGK